MTARLARTVAWCAWHCGLADDVALINVVEPVPGLGTASPLFACQRRRESYRGGVRRPNMSVPRWWGSVVPLRGFRGLRC